MYLHKRAALTQSVTYLFTSMIYFHSFLSMFSDSSAVHEKKQELRTLSVGKGSMSAIHKINWNISLILTLESLCVRLVQLTRSILMCPLIGGSYC